MKRAAPLGLDFAGRAGGVTPPWAQVKVMWRRLNQSVGSRDPGLSRRAVSARGANRRHRCLRSHGRPAGRLVQMEGTLGFDYQFPLATGDVLLHVDSSSRSGYNSDTSASRYTRIGGYNVTTRALAIVSQAVGKLMCLRATCLIPTTSRRSRSRPATQAWLSVSRAIHESRE